MAVRVLRLKLSSTLKPSSTLNPQCECRDAIVAKPAAEKREGATLRDVDDLRVPQRSGWC